MFVRVRENSRDVQKFDVHTCAFFLFPASKAIARTCTIIESHSVRAIDFTRN